MVKKHHLQNKNHTKCRKYDWGTSKTSVWDDTEFKLQIFFLKYKHQSGASRKEVVNAKETIVKRSPSYLRAKDDFILEYGICE